MSILLRILAVIVGILLAALVLFVIGLQVQPRPLASHPETTPDLDAAPVPANQPAPVARYYQAALGIEAPVIQSAVLSGRGRMRLNGIRFPVRYRFVPEAGQGYRHYMEITVFGRPLFKVNEHYLDGNFRMVLPVGVVEGDPKSSLAANLTLWGESIALPSLFAHDPRVRWEPIDHEHARLVVPAGQETDSFVVAFERETGLIRSMEAPRWKSSDSPAKLDWRIDVGDWKQVHGMQVPPTGP